MLSNRYENENDEEDSNQVNIDFEHKFNEKGHKLTATFQTENNDEIDIIDEEIHAALCLFIEASKIDGKIDKNEFKLMNTLLVKKFF